MADLLNFTSLLLFSIGLFLAVAAFGLEGVRQSRWFIPIGLGLTAAAIALAANRPGLAFRRGDSFGTIFELALILITLFPYGIFMAYCAATAIFRLKSILLSEDAVPVSREFSAAERAVIAKDYQKAIDIYRGEIRKDEKDVEARRRLAEVLVIAGRPQDAVSELQHAVTLCEDEERASLLMLRMADIVERGLADAGRAKEVLQELLKRYPASYYARFARERLGNSSGTS